MLKLMRKIRETRFHYFRNESARISFTIVTISTDNFQ